MTIDKQSFTVLGDSSPSNPNQPFTVLGDESPSHRMQYYSLKYPQYSAEVKVSAFRPVDGVGEYNLMVTLDNTRPPYARQLDNLLRALALATTTLPMTARPVFKRYFMSDASNQAHSLPVDEPCAISLVEQQPLNGTKLALWVYMIDNVEVMRDAFGMVRARHSAYTHLWRASMTVPYMTSEVATTVMLGDLATMLRDHHCTLADNCLRTWFFVHDVDINYQGVVRGRNMVFESSGLTVDTHFIASTGIGGKNADTNALVALDAYSVHGIKPEQVKYLTAPTHLNPTYEYGVAFERGTAVDYGDRRQVLISGTASINNHGEIVHPGDVVMQTERMLENIGALLANADCGWRDVAYGIVYLRDTADYDVVREIIDKRLPDLPLTIVLAPVCRQGWLIEMECAAIKPADTAYAPL